MTTYKTDMSGTCYVKNPNLSGLDVDELFHIGLGTRDDLKATFGDVKVSMTMPTYNMTPDTSIVVINQICNKQKACYQGSRWR